MSPFQTARTPVSPLYRIGHLPEPLAWPPWGVVGGGRFDDPEREYRVLYAASSRRGPFVEILAQFRPSLEILARLRQVVGSDEPPPSGHVPVDWYKRRAVAQLRLVPGQRWLDLRVPQTREALRAELAPILVRLGLTDLDLGRVLGPGRALTQAIGRWAYEHEFAGLAYVSRLDQAQTLWALFEGAAFEPVGRAESITPEDADLVATAQLFGLTVSE